MNFDLTEQQELFMRSIASFCEREMDLRRLHSIFDSDTGFDANLWHGAMDLGIGGLAVPEEFGGTGLELLDLALAMEILGHHGVPGPFIGHALATMAVNMAGTEEQRSRLLPDLASGDRIATIAFGEDGSRWSPDDWRIEDGKTITGCKIVVLYPTEADVIVVGLAGGKLGLVEREASGVEIEMADGMDRTRRIGSVSFQNTPCEPLEAGKDAARRVFEAGLVLTAADAFGGGTRCVYMAAEYAKVREQFGTKIGNFQGLKHFLANTAVEIEPARALYWYAAHAFDAIPGEAPRAAALAKAHLTDRFMQVSRNCIEAHGGIGYTWEYDAHIWLKRAIFDRVFLGAPSYHRERAAQMAGW